MAALIYTNPITTDMTMSMRDHQILKFGDYGHLTDTSSPYGKRLNPGVHLFWSYDLLDWTFIDWPILMTWTERLVE